MPDRIDENWIERLVHLGLRACDAERMPDPGPIAAIGFVDHSHDGRRGRPPTILDIELALRLVEEEGLTVREVCERSVIWDGRKGRWMPLTLGTLRRKLKEAAAVKKLLASPSHPETEGESA
ncbi:MAG: hypothetical protein O7H41_20840 [Planctomycetota bacterium]|nr:hypothetical protein [Planctomycetota bacterium]